MKNHILRNIVAFILGALGGGSANMGLVELGNKLLPIEGLDYSNPNQEEFMKAFAELIPTLEPKFFLFPFLAHALGTLVGAFIAFKIAASAQMKFALGIGALFFIGGVAINYMLPGQMWFSIVDILFAYFPMAWLGGKLAERKAQDLTDLPIDHRLS
jgi:hypothetical protein